MFRASPVETAVILGVPLLVAGGQLVNSLVTGLSFSISIPFAIVVVGYTGMLTQYSVARFRRRELERDLFGRS